MPPGLCGQQANVLAADVVERVAERRVSLRSFDLGQNLVEARHRESSAELLTLRQGYGVTAGTSPGGNRDVGRRTHARAADVFTARSRIVERTPRIIQLMHEAENFIQPRLALRILDYLLVIGSAVFGRSLFCCGAHRYRSL